MPMDIYGGLMNYLDNNRRYKDGPSPEGRKVVFLDDNGRDYDLEYARKYFTKGQVLTVKEVYVDGWSSDVEFIGYPELRFNTVMFEDVESEAEPTEYFTPKIYTNDFIQKIYDVTNNHEKKSLIEMTLKASEELGELSQAVLSYSNAPGCGYKGLGLDDILEEACDVIIVVTALLARADIDTDSIKPMIDKKIEKWIAKATGQ